MYKYKCTKCNKEFKTKPVFSKTYEISNASSLLVISPAKYLIELCPNCSANLIEQLIGGLSETPYIRFIQRNSTCKKPLVLRETT